MRKMKEECNKKVKNKRRASSISYHKYKILVNFSINPQLNGNAMISENNQS
jgi:hypothetical protein